VRSLTLEPARVIRRDRFVPWYIYAHPRQNVRHMLAVLILLFVCEVGAMVACQKWRRVLLMLKGHRAISLSYAVSNRRHSPGVWPLGLSNEGYRRRAAHTSCQTE